jgi:hypothetical protein
MLERSWVGFAFVRVLSRASQCTVIGAQRRRMGDGLEELSSLWP